MTTRIYRSESEKMIGGVCSGLAKYFAVDVVLVRLLWVLAVFLGGSGVVAYIIAWIIIPPEPGVGGKKAAMGSEESTSEEGYTPGHSSSRHGSKSAGLILIGIGFFFLVKQFVPFFPWDKLWPLIIIAIGLVVMAKGTNGESR